MNCKVFTCVHNKVCKSYIESKWYASNQVAQSPFSRWARLSQSITLDKLVIQAEDTWTPGLPSTCATKFT